MTDPFPYYKTLTQFTTALKTEYVTAMTSDGEAREIAQANLMSIVAAMRDRNYKSQDISAAIQRALLLAREEVSPQE